MESSWCVANHMQIPAIETRGRAGTGAASRACSVLSAAEVEKLMELFLVVREADDSLSVLA